MEAGPEGPVDLAGQARPSAMKAPQDHAARRYQPPLMLPSFDQPPCPRGPTPLTALFLPTLNSRLTFLLSAIRFLTAHCLPTHDTVPTAPCAVEPGARALKPGQPARSREGQPPWRSDLPQAERAGRTGPTGERAPARAFSWRPARAGVRSARTCGSQAAPRATLSRFNHRLPRCARAWAPARRRPSGIRQSGHASGHS
jgi:hypothetical protein